MSSIVRATVYLVVGFVALGFAIASVLGAHIEAHLVATAAFTALSLVCFEISIQYSKR